MITNETWKRIENEFKIFSQLEVKVDEHIIKVKVGQETELKFALAVYIDGWIKGEWALSEDRPAIVPKVWRPKKQYKYPPTAKRKLTEIFGKTVSKRYPDLEEYKVYYIPSFSSIKSLVRHWKKIENIELIEFKP